MNIPVCCKFTQLHSHQILIKSVNIWFSYCEKQKGELFLKHSVVTHHFICCSKHNKFRTRFHTQHVDSSDGVCFNGLDWIVHVMRRRCRWCQVVDLVNWQRINTYLLTKRHNSNDTRKHGKMMYWSQVLLQPTHTHAQTNTTDTLRLQWVGRLWLNRVWKITQIILYNN